MSTKGERTKAHILKSAAVLFCERDFDGASIADIAAHANVKKASVFYHFGTKEDLFQEVIRDFYQREQTILSGAIAMQGTLRERLHNLIDEYLAFVEKEWPFISLVQRLAGSRHPMGKYVGQHVDPVVGWLQTAVGEVTPTDGPKSFRHVYTSLAGAMNFYYTHAAVLQRNWPHKLLSKEGLAERREHVHWLLDVLLDAFDVPTP